MRVRSLEEAAELTRAAMASPELRAVGDALARMPADGWRGVVEATAASRPAAAEWEAMRAACADAGISAESRALERWLLLQAGLPNLPRVAALPLHDEVKGLLYDEFCFVAQPHRRWVAVLDPAHSGFRSMCKLLRLERFPAGQLHWEVSGYPRSQLLKAPPAELPRVLRFVALEMRGLRPYFVTHLATRWAVPFTMTEKEDARACYRIARSMALQPGVRGYMSGSWLNDPELPRVAPHLAWRLDKVRHGALLTTAGPAPESSGFLEGSAERRRLYESGAWRPKFGVILWPRRQMLAWADRFQHEPHAPT